MKWLEDELELNALHNSGRRRGSGNDKAALTQRTALSAALGGRVEVAALSTISGLAITPEFKRERFVNSLSLSLSLHVTSVLVSLKFYLFFLALFHR